MVTCRRTVGPVKTPVARFRPPRLLRHLAAAGWVDLGLAAAMGGSVLLAATAAAGAASPAELPTMAWLAVGGVAAATVLFRTAPVTGLLIGTATLLGYHVTVGDPLGLAWPLAVVVYGVARAGHLWVGAGFGGIYLAAFFVHLLIIDMPADGLALLHNAAQEGLLLAGALLVGEVVRTRVRQAETARDLLVLHQQQQEQQTQRRIVEERLRIARDLHDLTAHTVSVVSLHAGVARERFDHDPQAARASLHTIEQTSKQAAGELRELVGLLRSDETAPADALDAIRRAVGVTRSAGLWVDLQLDPSGPPLAGPAGLATARIVQESLTNVLRHAEARNARVRIGGEDGALDISITDDGVGPAPNGTTPHPGVGLRGMRERAEALGGTLTHGHGSSGGFEVHARLPARSES